jgi:hypothetical protein
LFISLFFTTGCAQLQRIVKGPEVIIPQSEIPQTQNRDYVDHLEFLSSGLLKNKNIKFRTLSKSNESYLESIFTRIVANNELLVPSKPTPKFYLVEEKIPFIFSLPGYQFFFSTGLIKKYFKNESLLVSALCFEIIRSGRNMYEAKRVYPIGYREVPQMLSLTRLSLESRIEIYKWTYFALKRAEYDATALLNWIQTQNKNTLDFSWQIRDPRGVSREEFLFKNFLVSQGLDRAEQTEANSSRNFYKFQDTYR